MKLTYQNEAIMKYTITQQKWYLLQVFACEEKVVSPGVLVTCSTLASVPVRNVTLVWIAHASSSSSLP